MQASRRPSDKSLDNMDSKMKITHTKRALPKDWYALHKGEAFIEKDIRVNSGRLRAKVLIFHNTKSLRKFWKSFHGASLGRKCLGVVNGLSCEIFKVEKDGSETNRRTEVDARYFCVIGLVKNHLTLEVVTHESVHAAFCYTKRVNRKNLWHDALSNDEETICYPAGRIAAEIGLLANKNGI